MPPHFPLPVFSAARESMQQQNNYYNKEPKKEHLYNRKPLHSRKGLSIREFSGIIPRLTAKRPHTVFEVSRRIDG